MLKKQKRNSLQNSFRDSIKYLKKEEWLALKESIDNFRDKIIINLLYSSGVRVAELSLMKIEEIDFNSGFIRIPKENTKTKQSRTVRIGKEVLSDLKAFLHLEERKKGYLFRSRQGKKLTTRRIEQIIHKYYYQILNSDLSRIDKDTMIKYFKNKTIGYDGKGKTRTF